MPSQPTQLFLVRHGESTANARNILQGCTVDEPLSAAGRTQAHAAGEALRHFPIRRVYSSSMLRARQTAEAIAAVHSHCVEPLEKLHEVDVGRWAGKTAEVVKHEMPEAWEQYLSDGGEFPTPGGESYRDVLDRVKPVLDKLLLDHPGETIVVVAHNVVNRVYLADLLGIPLRRSTSLRQHNCAINLIRRDTHGDPVAVMVNSVLHLDGW
jgi:broad specificity phosphatase PhoE